MSMTPTQPGTSSLRMTSELGFQIEVAKDFEQAGGVVSQAHAVLADQYWRELMTDLQGAGYAASMADSKSIRGAVKIYLYQPQNNVGDIRCLSGGAMAGSCYAPFALSVPGTYPTAHWPDRPNSQPLKHEMLHHWCMMTSQGTCLEPGKKERDGHVWRAPNGTNIWEYTWK